jgi:hypothetical protein
MGGREINAWDFFNNLKITNKGLTIVCRDFHASHLAT